MSLRIFNALIITSLLAACGGGTPEPEGNRIDCAIGAGADFANVCVLERVSSEQLLIHGPNGGFRRFAITPEGDSAPLSVVDGAANVVLINSGGDGSLLEFSVDSDVYRFDASLLNAAANE